MVKIYNYMNKECGNILTENEMRKEWAEMYDGGDPTNPLGWQEYYIRIDPIVIPVE